LTLCRARAHIRSAQGARLVSDHLTTLYPTTLLRRHIDGRAANNLALTDLIAQMAASGPNASFGTSTKGGFQTREDFLAHDHPLGNHPAMVALKGHIGDAIQHYAGILIRQECARMPARVDFTLWGWAVSLESGNTQNLHVHSGADISGVYYIAAPDGALGDSDDGKICFYDPRPRANMSQLLTQITRHRESPVPGDMVLFPSWLEHSVDAFAGEGRRICVAFNVRLTMS
jgi:uncharacterized protein (TIGR02466 family)